MPSSDAADYGTGAHELAEYMLGGFVNDLDGYTEEQIELVTEYVNWIKSLEGAIKKKEGESPTRIVEQRFNLKSVSPAAFGTNDVALSIEFGVLHIIDLKFGRRFVSPNRNKQLMYYALGIIEELSLSPSKVILWIYGPRMGLDTAAMSWECPMEDLKEFHEELKAGALRVDSEPDTYVTGDHCMYCNKGECPKIAEEAEGFFSDIEPIEQGGALVPSVKFDGKPTEELLGLLAYKDMFSGCFTDIACILKARAEGGEVIPGHKLVEAFGNRAFKEEVTDEHLIQLGVPKKEIYAKPKRKSAPQMEKALKKEFPAKGKEAKAKRKTVLDQFNAMVEKPSRGVKLVHESQPGEALLPSSADFGDIEQLEGDFADL